MHSTSPCSRNRSRLAVRLLCLLLCAATWRGPLPWLHQHADAANAGLHEAQTVEHCRQYHGNGLATVCSDWHWHVLLPWTQGAQDNEQTPVDHDPLIRAEIVVSTGAIDTAAFDFAHSLLTGLVVEASSIDRLDSATQAEPGRSFLNSLLQSVPLRTVTGVALC
ncbi:MAG: hypothetical protein KDA58_12995 [Planctomycetaceae bacterium]|nr:hypothetical protein [Planctomycetaceae bacterium]